MFWKFGAYASISTIETLLDKPDVSLEDLLDESDLITELKAPNAKLIEFLRGDQALEKLLRYVIAPKTSAGNAREVPPVVEKKSEKTERTGVGFFAKSTRTGRSRTRELEETDYEKREKQRLKYAYVACEILSSEVWSITEALMESHDHLREFWQYIRTAAPLDSSQAGYFTKVNEALLEKKTEDMITFIKSIDGVVVDMMKHVDCPMVMDLLLKLISLEKDPGGQGIVDWLQTQNLIPILLSYITPDHSPATQASAGDFLKAIITISANATGQDASVIGPNELTRQLVSERCVQDLIHEMLRGGSPLTVGVGIMIEVIRKNNSDYDTEAQIGPVPQSSDPIYLGTLLRIFSKHIVDFMDLILSPKHTIITGTGSETIQRHDLKVAWGDKIEPLGFDRFKTCELMAELLHCSNMTLLNEAGSEAEIKHRDAERERLKNEGNLASERRPSAVDFGTSVDSSGFHHTEAFAPLGESPENIKSLEVQNSGEEEDFEDVGMPGTVGVVEDLVEGLDKLLPDEQVVADRLNDVHLANEASTSSTTPDTFSVRTVDDGVVTPAPLFDKRTQSIALSEPSTTESEGATNVTSPEFLADQPAATKATANMDLQTQASTVDDEGEGSAVVGDLLKMMFVEHHVVPTILDFFFRFPWNNFLHNVVYDVVQQVFNGAMDRGFNRRLSIDLFETGRITEKIVEGQKRSDKAQQERKMRLGYMGHLTLVAEEVVKYTERQAPETLDRDVVDRISDPEWIHYLEHTLAETRDRDHAILGGVRPDSNLGPKQAVLNTVATAQGGYGNSITNSAALPSPGLDSMDLANAGGTGYNFNNAALISGFGNSDDEEEEEMEENEFRQDNGDTAHHSELDLDYQEYAAKEVEKEVESNALSVPAPLTISPARAKNQLESLLAEQLAVADTGRTDMESSTTITSTAGTNEPAPIRSTTPATAAKKGERSVSFDQPEVPGVRSVTRSGGLSESFRGFNEDSGASSSSSSGSDDSEEANNDRSIVLTTRLDGEERSGATKRRTTSEALERRPLDDGDEDDDVQEETRGSPVAEGGSSGSGSSGNNRVETSAPEQPAPPMRQGDWPARGDGGGGGRRQYDDEDDEEDDAAIEMGTKYMRRRASNQ